MKHPIKKLSKHPKIHQCLAWIGAYYVRFVLKTSTLHLHIPESCQPYFNGDNNAIFAMWHSRIMLMQCNIPQKRKMHAMVSAHRDGRMIGDVLSYFGVVAVHGSTSKEGGKALKTLIRDYKAGHNVSITPDGPRGPARKVSEGLAQLAMLTNAPVICASYAASRAKHLRSWDRFMIALPFSRLYFVASEPLHYQRDDTMDKYANRELLRADIENCLNQVTDASDALVKAA